MKAYSIVVLNPDGSVATSTTYTNLIEQTTQNHEYVSQMAAPGQRVIQVEVGPDGNATVVSNKVKS